MITYKIEEVNDGIHTWYEIKRYWTLPIGEIFMGYESGLTRLKFSYLGDAKRHVRLKTNKEIKLIKRKIIER